MVPHIMSERGRARRFGSVLLAESLFFDPDYYNILIPSAILKPVEESDNLYLGTVLESSWFTYTFT